MRFVCATICVFAALVSPVAVASAAAQSAAGGAPTLIPISGALQTSTGEPRTGTVLLVLSLYEGGDDDSPRWVEYQYVTLDAAGRYDVQFGSELAEGLPADLFSGATPVRWVGVAVENEPEQPRMMLVGVPYASKATTADNLAGKLASDFVLTANLTDQVRAVLQEDRTGGNGPVTNAFAPNTLQKGDGSGSIDSTVVEVGGNVGIGTATPDARLHVAGNMHLTGNIFGIVNTLNFSNSASDFGIHIPGPGGNIRFRNSANSSDILTLADSGTIHFAGSTIVAGNVTVNGNIAAKYQDVAEWVDSVEPLEPGTVVIIDETGHNRVMAASSQYDSRVAGAVSPQPGLILGEPGEGKVLVAQSGRVRIKVDARYGAIKAGDLLVSSPRKGYAMRSKPVRVGGASMHRPGTVLGKALEPLASGSSEILVLLTLQ